MKSDKDLVSSVLSKASQMILNEALLIKNVNESHKKLGIAAHLIQTFLNLAWNLNQSQEKIVKKSGQRGVDPDDLLNILKVYKYNISVLEDSQEYKCIFHEQ